ncbi:MAG: hypothetical protein Q8L29_03045 [archaeon]|nr:hypothetical protein [archaeon]
MEIVQDITKGKLKSAYVVAPFDEAKATLESKSYRIISLQENAQLRMQEGADSSVSKRGNYTREGVLYLPKKGIFLVRNSPILDKAKEATNCNRSRKEFYLTIEQVEKALTDSVEFKSAGIPTNRFGDDKITSFAFGKDAKAYGEFLRESGINSINTYVVNSESNPFARQLWLYGLVDGDRSSLLGDSKGLGYGNGVRGVSASAKGASQTQKSESNKVIAYTPEQISKVLKKKGLAGIEGILLDGLKQ